MNKFKCNACLLFEEVHPKNLSKKNNINNNNAHAHSFTFEKSGGLREENMIIITATSNKRRSLGWTVCLVSSFTSTGFLVSRRPCCHKCNYITDCSLDVFRSFYTFLVTLLVSVARATSCVPQLCFRGKIWVVMIRSFWKITLLKLSTFSDIFREESKFGHSIHKQTTKVESVR